MRVYFFDCFFTNLFSSHDWVAIDHPYENTVEHARRDRGLKVDDDTSEMMKDVERELTVTKACSHQHVVSILGLMVGPGRIGIHHTPV